MSATYKSRFNEEQLRALCNQFLRKIASKEFLDIRIVDPLIEDILDQLEVNNLDNKTITNLINKWNEKVK